MEFKSEYSEDVQIVDCRIEDSGEADLFSMEDLGSESFIMAEDEDIFAHSGHGGELHISKEEANSSRDKTDGVIHLVTSSQFEVIPRPPLTAKAREEAEKEIITKLLHEEISYFQVAELLGDDVNEEDEEADLEADHDDPDLKPTIIDHAAEFEQELSEHRKSRRRRGKTGRRRGRRSRKLPDAVLQGLMGEANLRFARREYEEATKMCMEIIRQYPNSSEPYETLGLIYEAKGLLSKSLQFLFIAAFLSSDSVLWEKLAEMFLNEKEDIPQAIFCWGRAIRANPENLSYHEERCKLYERIGDKGRALRGYVHMVKFLQPSQGADALKLAKVIAKIHFEKNDLNLAQEAMETAFKKHPSFVLAEDVNLLLELLMQREMFGRCVEVLVRHAGVTLSSESVSSDAFSALLPPDQVASATSLNFPPDIPMDLRAKGIIAFIRLQNFAIVEDSVNDMIENCKETYGDLLFEISEALKKAGHNVKAIEILEQILSCPTFDVAAVWLLYGECLFNCSRLEDAALAYGKVIEMAPQVGGPRVVLAGILQTLGRPGDALAALSNSAGALTGEPIDCQLCYHKCQILYDEGHFPDFIDMALLIFNRHFILIRSLEEVDPIVLYKRVSHKIDAVRDLRRARQEDLDDRRLNYTDFDVPLQDQWDLFKKVFNVLCSMKRFDTLQRLSLGALGSREFMRDKERANDLEFLALVSSLYNRDFLLAFSAIREFILKDPSNVRIWNLFAFILSKSEDLRMSRFVLRLAYRYPDSVPLSIFNGHLSLACGTYIFSISEYSHAFKKRPQEPLLPLMLGVTYIHMTCQKLSLKKNSLLLTGLAFLSTYVKLRGECQESFYNVGRAFHQVGLYPQALTYYRKALECPPFPSDSNGPCLDLTKDVAFHVSQIYRKNGNVDMAKYYINKYIRFD